jgi:hypothetical protein
MTNIWYRGSLGPGSGSALPGAVAALNSGTPTVLLQGNTVIGTSMSDTLSRTFNSVTDATNYMCVFSDPAGSVTSRCAAVEVLLGPTNKTYLAGVTSNLLVLSVGPITNVAVAQPKFQWYYNTVSNFSTATAIVNGSHYAAITNNSALAAAASTNNLWITNLLVADSGYYWCAVTNSIGAVIPQAAILNVTSPPPNITSITATNGGSPGNVVMTFTSSNPFDTTSSFTVLSSGIVVSNDPPPYASYTNNATAVISGSNPNFTVVVPRSGPTMFYRLLHK